MEPCRSANTRALRLTSKCRRGRPPHVPRFVQGWKRRRCPKTSRQRWAFRSSWASPKSITFTQDSLGSPLIPEFSSSVASMMLEGFRSRWTRPRFSAAAKARVTCIATRRATSGESGPVRRRRVSSVSPSKTPSHKSNPRPRHSPRRCSGVPSGLGSVLIVPKWKTLATFG